MPNFPLLKTGQQAVTASAVALPILDATPGEGIRVVLEALKANGASIFYGPSGVTIANGKELAAGTQDVLFVNGLEEIFVIAAAGGSSVSWVATNIGGA